MNPHDPSETLRSRTPRVFTMRRSNATWDSLGSIVCHPYVAQARSFGSTTDDTYGRRESEDQGAAVGDVWGPSEVFRGVHGGCWAPNRRGLGSLEPPMGFAGPQVDYRLLPDESSEASDGRPSIPKSVAGRFKIMRKLGSGSYSAWTRILMEYMEYMESCWFS